MAKRSQTKTPRPAGRPRHDDTLFYVHLEALNRRSAAPIHKITGKSKMETLGDRGVVDRQTIPSGTVRRRFYRFRKRLEAMEPSRQAHIERMIADHVEFLAAATEGPITAQ